MNGQTPTSPPVVDRAGTLGEGAAAEQGSGGPRTPGNNTPSFPPAPSAGNVSPRVIADQIKALSRQKRDAQRANLTSQVRSVNSRYWVYAGAVVLAATGVVGCRNYLSFQRDTALALANTRDAVVATPDVTAPVEQTGMPNPLQSLSLSSQAIYILGGRYETNDRGEQTGRFTDLPPNRSASVVSKLLTDVDLCRVYVSLGAKTEVVVSFEHVPGAVPLLDAEQCASVVPTLVPTPQDPMPTTTVKPS